MESFLNSVQSVAIILLLTATGYYCAARGWFSDGVKGFISKLLMRIAVPFMCAYSLRSKLTLDALKEAGPLLLVPLITIITNFLLAYAVAKLLRVQRKSFGVFMMGCALSNTLFIGFPMCTELFGSECSPYVIMFYMVSTCFTHGVGLTLIRWSGEADAKVSPLWILKKLITTPAIIGIIVGVLIVLLDYQPPTLLMNYGKYMNQIVTPLALLLTGKIIYEIGLKNLTMNRLLVVIMIFRFLVGPILCYGLCCLMGVQGMARDVFIVQAAMPVLSQAPVAAAEYGGDEQLAAKGAAISTLMTFIVIPVLMLILT